MWLSPFKDRDHLSSEVSHCSPRTLVNVFLSAVPSLCAVSICCLLLYARALRLKFAAERMVGCKTVRVFLLD